MLRPPPEAHGNSDCGKSNMKPKKRLVINRDWCKGCGICVAFCPKEVLVLDDRDKACWAYPEKCINCELCELRCPDMAITLEENKP